jgi:hypothetical protein
MDEALRRAYLAAMDIPVWIPRGEAEALAVAESASAVPTAEAAVAAPPAPAAAMPAQATRPGRGQAMLGEKTPDAEVQQKRAPAASVPANVDRMAFTFGFVRYGNTLLIDERQLAPRGEELACSICFAVEQSKRAAESQDFSWPPRGAPFVAAEARDAMLARIDKLGGGILSRLLLLGEAPAAVLLGWDGSRWLDRTPGVHRLDGLDCEMFLLPGLTDMLANPDAKRVAWQHLRAAGPGNA